MAVDPTTPTSYSDPFYDRLEAVMRLLGRHWKIFVLVLLLVIAGYFLLRTVLARSAEAESAVAFELARNEAARTNDTSPFEGLMEDTGTLYEYRSRAANVLVQQTLRTGDLDRAAGYARRGLELARQAENVLQRDALMAVHTLNLATIAFEQGNYEEALAGYTRVQGMPEQKVHSLQGMLGQVWTQLRQAELAEAERQVERAWRLRREALEDLRYCAELTIPGTEIISREARFALFDLEFRHPKILADTPPPPLATPGDGESFVAPPVESAGDDPPPAATEDQEGDTADAPAPPADVGTTPAAPPAEAAPTQP